ncbi:ribonuclease H family protein [Ochrobactrum quorumnocens]|jgi:ribonuclease HI|uniref:ribonuclease H n=1 Tax=Ochrobactrum quorumnocens TaxID=271865 RepID=A0A5N1JWH5_9HYPH|nr:ribonuclease HI [[Ochrobactrum] quorumnocens]KAA9368376.1 ribonuclease HI [[Ochrobactrum] quorumnocens]
MDSNYHIHTDGSFDVASHLGGWAFVVYEGDCQRYAASGSAPGISNNSFEILALLNAMSWIATAIPTRTVTLWTDSVYAIEGCLRWRAIWRSNGWRQITAKQHVRRRKIPDMVIWRELDDLLQRHPHVAVQWCKGHAGVIGNELADRQARDAAQTPPTLRKSVPGMPLPSN